MMTPFTACPLRAGCSCPWLIIIVVSLGVMSVVGASYIADYFYSGGDAAKFEPLSQHYVEYEWALAQYFGYGVMPVYRGDRQV